MWRHGFTVTLTPHCSESPMSSSIFIYSTYLYTHFHMEHEMCSCSKMMCMTEVGWKLGFKTWMTWRDLDAKIKGGIAWKGNGVFLLEQDNVMFEINDQNQLSQFKRCWKWGIEPAGENRLTESLCELVQGLAWLMTSYHEGQVRGSWDIKTFFHFVQFWTPWNTLWQATRATAARPEVHVFRDLF